MRSNYTIAPTSDLFAEQQLHRHTELALLLAVRQAAREFQTTSSDPEHARARDRYVRALHHFSDYVLHGKLS